MDEQSNKGVSQLSDTSERVNAVAFDSAELRAGPTMGQGLYLVVSGPAPTKGAHVRLLPVLGDSSPAYRRIDIVFEEHQVSDLPPSTVQPLRYEKSMPLSGLAGTKGIELVGANGRKKFDLF